MVVPVLAGNHILEVKPHLTQLIRQRLQPIYLVMHLLAQLALTRILDISQQMLHAHFFSFSCPNGCWHVNELPMNVTVAIGLLLGEICFRWETHRVFIINFYYYKNGRCIVSPEDFVDINIIFSDVRSR